MRLVEKAVSQPAPRSPRPLRLKRPALQNPIKRDILYVWLSFRASVASQTNRETEMETGTETVKRGHAQMLKGGVIMDVVTPEHARIAEDAGACAVMALERVPADIRAHGGVARMSDPGLILQIMDAVTIPVMAKCRIGHFVEAQILEAIGVDYIDESEVLTPADEAHHIDKRNFKVEI